MLTRIGQKLNICQILNDKLTKRKKAIFVGQKLRMIQNLNLMDFDDQMKHGYALVDYWAPWCQPCLDQNPLLEEIAKALSPRIKVFKVDINDNRVISNKEGVRNIPLLILYQDSKQIARFQGIQSKEIIIQSITNILHDL
jgi:thioredoxin 1